MKTARNILLVLMPRSYELVDRKLAEAEFFLKRLRPESEGLFALKCYFSAFVSACRTVTLAMQACLKGVEGSEEWYESQREILKSDQLARFMHKIRDIETHIGETLIDRGVGYRDEKGNFAMKMYFGASSDLPEDCVVPEEDVVTCCQTHFSRLASIVLASYEKFGNEIDPHEFLSQENFERIGKTIEDAEEEIIGIRGWTNAPGVPLEARWQMLRDSVSGCGVNSIFQEYCGRQIPSAERYIRDHPEKFSI